MPVFTDKEGKEYLYEMDSDKPTPASEEKLKRFQDKVDSLRKSWQEDPAKRMVYEAQAKMMKQGIAIIEKKLKFLPPKKLL